MSTSTASGVVSGFTEVVEAQKAVQLTTAVSKFGPGRLIISFSNSNTGAQVAIGASKATTNAKKELGKEEGVILLKGGTLVLDGVDPTQVWVDVEKAKDGVSWIAYTA